MSSQFLRDPHLATLYQRTPGTVAFVDESYREHPFNDQRPFYAMSALTLEVDQLDRFRDVMTEIAGGLYWHTTEAFKLGREDDIHEMATYLADHVQWSIVAVEATITQRGVSEARQTCLSALTREVTRGSGSSAVRLIVADRNRDNAVNRADQLTVSALRSAGVVDPNVTLYHGRMGQEPVLWGADAIAWSTYRVLAVDDGRWIAPMRDVLTVLDARTGRALEMKQPQAAAATPRAQPTTGPIKGGQSVVASDPSVPTSTATTKGFVHGSTTLDDLARRATQLHQDLGPRGVLDGNSPAALLARLHRTDPPPPTAGAGPHV